MYNVGTNFQLIHSQVVEDTVKQYKLLDSPWVATGRVLENGMKIPSVSPQAVISAVMLVRSELAFKGCSFFQWPP